MRRPSVPPLRIYALVVVGSLLVLGMAQAAWSLGLQILGTINTSDAAMAFVAAFTNDDGTVDNPELDPGDSGSCPIGGRPDSSCDPVGGGPDPRARRNRDIARCTAGVEPGGLRATVELDQAYPAYRCGAWFAAANTGSLPLRISGLRLNGTPLDFPSQTTTDLNGDNRPDLQLEIAGIVPCQQLDPGQQAIVELGQHVLGSAPTNTALEFTVEVEFAQWNVPCGANADTGLEAEPLPTEP